MRAGILAIGTVLLAVGFVGAIGPFDIARYRPGHFGDVLTTHPQGPGLIINHDVPIRTRATYLGKFGVLGEDSRRLIGAWSEAMKVASMLEVFQQEVKVRQKGVEYLLPVQESLARLMQDELRPGEDIELFVIYIGQIGGHRIFLINAFNHEGPHRPRR